MRARLRERGASKSQTKIGAGDVAFFAPDHSGGGHLRSVWPAAELTRRGWRTQVSTTPPAAEVVIVHRPLQTNLLGVVRRMQAEGMRVLISEDDDLTTAHLTGNEHVIRQLTPTTLRLHADAIRMADGLIVTTPKLEKVYGYAKRTFVIPNYLPEQMGRLRRVPLRDGHIRVGWAGIVQTHRADLEWFAPVARDAMRGAMFSTIGDSETKAILRIPRCETFPFAHSLTELYRTMARADVGIVPLEPNEFNESKSFLKALEYFTQGVPVVATDLPEQRRLITHGVDGFLASTPQEFASYVQLLVRDLGLRRSMGAMAAAKAATLTIEQHGAAWETCIRTTQEASWSR